MHRLRSSQLVARLAALIFAGLACHLAAAQTAAPHLLAGAAAPAMLAGQSATLLANGKWLLIGGRDENQQPTTGVWRYEPEAGTRTLVATRLAEARADHASTVLPDGSVLVLGGVGVGGIPIRGAERFDPVTETFQSVSTLTVIARARHRATVLADGRVLVTGGVDRRGNALYDAEVFDPFTFEVERFNVKAETARFSHLAQLLPSHTVLLWGGYGANGEPDASAEIFDPAEHRFSPFDPQRLAGTLAELTSNVPPAVVDSEPPAGAEEVAGGSPLSIRFSKLLDVTTLNAETVVLHGPGGQIAARVTPTENGLVVFVIPTRELLPASSYALIIAGAADRSGHALEFTAIGFKTRSINSSGDPSTAAPGASLPGASQPPTDATRPSSGESGVAGAPATPAGDFAETYSAGNAAAAPDDDESWNPGPEHRKGNWTSGRVFAHSRDHLRQAKGLRGLLDRLSERARSAVLERMQATGELAAFSDVLGASAILKPARAVLQSSGASSVSGQVLRLNGKPLANVTLSIAGRSARTDAAGEFVLKNVPQGLQILRIDGRSANQDGKVYGRFEYRMEVKPGPNDLDFTLWMPRLDTRHVVKIPSPTTTEVVVTHPSIPGLELRIPAGSVIRDAEGKIVTELSITPIPTDQPPFPLPGFHIPTYYTIQPGGAYIQALRREAATGARLTYPNFGAELPGARASFWNYDATFKGWYIYGTGTVSADAKQVVPDPGVVIYEFSGAMINTGVTPPADGPKPCTDQAADPVSCHTGLFLEVNTDLSLADVLPLELTRTYRQNDPNSRQFGLGTNHSFSTFLWSANQYQETDLVLPDGGRVHYVRTSPGTGWTDAVFEHTATPGEFYKSKIAWNGNGWNLTLRDGRTMVYGDTAPLQSLNDRYGNTITLMRTGTNAFGNQVGNITRLVSHHGRWIEFTYEGNRVKTATDNSGRTYNYTYDTSGRLFQVTDPEGGITEYGYDALHRMTTVKDPRLNTKVTNDQFDAKGRIKKQIYADQTTNLFDYTEEANGKVTQVDVTDERGSVRRFKFNAAGYTVSETRALGRLEEQTVSYERDPATNQVKFMTDGLKRVTAYEYDDLGNRKTETRLFGTADAVSWSYVYDPVFSQLTSATDPLHHTTTYVHDSLGNLKQVLDANQNTTDLTYDEAGRARTVTRYSGSKPLTTTLDYDGPDLVSITDPLGRTTTLFPDALGRVVAVIDALGNRQRIGYDKLDRVTSRTDPLGNVVHLEYDRNGNLETFTDARGNPTHFTYDVRNRMQTKQDALGKIERYDYDETGNLDFVTDRKGQVSGFEYDRLDRRTKASFGATSTINPVYQNSIDYIWDEGNRLKTIIDSVSGTIERGFDDRFDMIKQETSAAGTVDYTYYANGLRETMTPSGGTATTYIFDPGNRLTDIKQAGGSGAAQPVTEQKVKIQYDEADRRTLLTLPNGSTLEYGWDDVNQLRTLTYKQANGTLIGDLSYSYDAAGRRTSMGGSLARTVLPQAVASATYDVNNRLIDWDGKTLSYDDNGNLSADGTMSYTWNERNQLIASASGDSTFAYDGLGRRRSRSISGTNYLTLYDGWNAIQLKQGATVVENRLMGLALDEVFGRTRGGANQSYLTDALGSVLKLAGSSGTTAVDYTYSAYGETSESPAGNTNLIKYTGREQDTGDLYYYRARYYHPQIGRFISEDPIGLAGGLNPYLYVRNNPLRWVDPLGLIDIPSPNGVVPGGPWEPAGPGQLPGDYYGPKKPSGPRDICRWVPPEGEGGPPGSEGYWKTKTPEQKGWDRFDQRGNPITPEEAHPSPRNRPSGEPIPPTVPSPNWLFRIGVGIGLMLYSGDAY